MNCGATAAFNTLRRSASAVGAPRDLGLSLIFCGVMAVVISIWEYHWGLRYLWSGTFAVIAGATREGRQTPLLAVAIVLALIGIFAFFAVLLRLV